MIQRAILAVAVVVFTANFTIVRLETPAPGMVAALAINSNGYAAGSVTTPGGGIGAMVWKPTGVMIPVPAIHSFMEANGLNDAGTVVGVAPHTQGFYWNIGASTVYTLPTFGSPQSRAYAVNQSGDIASAFGSGGLWRAVILPAGGGAIDIGHLGGGSPLAYAIADAPLAAGVSSVDPASSETRGFVWIDGSLYGVNRSGQIVGTCGTTSGASAVLWTADGIVDLNTWLPPGPVGS